MSKETEELISSEDMDTSGLPDSVSAEKAESEVTEETPDPETSEEAETSVETEEAEESEVSEETEESEESEDSEAADEVEESEVSEETEKSEESESTEESAESDENDEAEASEEPQSEAAPLNEKILAIKSALWEKEDERQQEETKLQIADKVKKYKNVMENGEQPEPEQKAPKSASEASPNKKKHHKKKSGKKTKKKQKNSVFPRKGDKPLDVIRKCVFLASSAIFVFCLALIVEYFWNNHYNSTLNDDLSVMYQETLPPQEQEETVAPTEESYEYYGFLPNAERLLEINPDVAGWISIPGTDVSYPVLQRRGNPDGNEYYLKRNIYHEDAHAGSIFMDYRNDFDYVIDGKKQLANSANLIIYGHNMHDYSMFGSLKHYINDANYYGEHPIVELNSNYRKYQYKIFGMIIVDINDESDTKFDYWNQLEFADERAFYDYVNEVKRRTIRLNDVDVKYGDELLTLSTCNSTFSNGRLVVFARKVREGEDLYAGTQTSTANPNIKWPNSYYRWNKSTYDPEAEFVPYG